MKNGTYCIYKRTENMYCNAFDGNEEMSCKDCFGTFKTQDCYLQHKKNKVNKIDL